MSEDAGCTLPFQYAINFWSNWVQIGSIYFIQCLICLFPPLFLSTAEGHIEKLSPNSNWNQPGNGFILLLTAIEIKQDRIIL